MGHPATLDLPDAPTDRRIARTEIPGLIGLGAFVESASCFMHYLLDDMRTFYAYVMTLHLTDPEILLERTQLDWYNAFRAWVAHDELNKIDQEMNVIDIKES